MNTPQSPERRMLYLRAVAEQLIGGTYPDFEKVTNSPKQATEERIEAVATKLRDAQFDNLSFAQRTELLIFSDDIRDLTAYEKWAFKNHFSDFWENKKILERSQKALDARVGIAEGDYIELPNGKFDRVTYVHLDEKRQPILIQTGGSSESGGYHLSESGYVDYSGSLDHGYEPERVATEPHAAKPGTVWFFSNGRARAHNGVYFNAQFKVYKLLK